LFRARADGTPNFRKLRQALLQFPDRRLNALPDLSAVDARRDQHRRLITRESLDSEGVSAL
jgi:hypothetical protein